MQVFSTFYVGFALLMLSVGVILVPLPFPLGVPLIVMALLILIRESKIAKKAIIRLRQKSERVDAVFEWLERTIPTPAARIIKRTRPERSTQSSTATLA